MAERVVLPRVEDAADVFPDDDFRLEGIDELRILEGQEATLVGQPDALALGGERLAGRAADEASMGPHALARSAKSSAAMSPRFGTSGMRWRRTWFAIQSISATKMVSQPSGCQATLAA